MNSNLPTSQSRKGSGAIVKIVTYHYVRPLAESRYPGIKGITLERFDDQLDHLTSRYDIISMADLVAGFDDPGSLPERPVLLTFDDGYIDHFEHVFPRLDERGIPGAFYPASAVLEDQEILEVNKIHFLLAAANIDAITTALFKSLDDLREEHNLPTEQECLATYAKPSRWDGPKVTMVKRLLQRGLPQPARGIVLNDLFLQFVGTDPEVFWRDLYMTDTQVRCLIRHGMHVGSHGYSHRRLADLATHELEYELTRASETLRRLEVPRSQWTFCYPHGSWSDEAVDVIRGAGFTLALALGGEDAVVDVDPIFAVPRVDTNQVNTGSDGGA